MAVPAQFPKFINPKWVVFIKDNAFSTLYDVYIRNFDVKSSCRKEYSVIWFRQIWRTLCALARQNHPMSMGVEDIENYAKKQKLSIPQHRDIPSCMNIGREAIIAYGNAIKELLKGGYTKESAYTILQQTIRQIFSETL